MFRKLISNLSFSPALVGQIGFYAKRLKKEEAVRRLGLIVTVLALIMQSFAVFNPPQSANAASPNDVINGGITSVNEVLYAYDHYQDVRALFNHQGVTRDDISRMTSCTLNVTDDHGIYSYGRLPKVSASQGEQQHNVVKDDGGYTTFYSRPMHYFYSIANGRKVRAFCGQSATGGGNFWIIKECGNLATRTPVNRGPEGAITSDCDAIWGWAIDRRYEAAKVRVQIFAGGVPGQGEMIYNDVAAIGNGHEFKVAVPTQYRDAPNPVPVYGVMVPLAGWNTSTVDIGSTSIPPHCYPAPVAECQTLTATQTSRTKFELSAQTSVANGATVSGYTFVVADQDGEEVVREQVASTETTASVEVELTEAGTYSASVIVTTSLGERTSEACAKPIEVVPPEVCPLNPELSVEDPNCKPCPEDPSLWFEDPDCAAKVVYGKSGTNVTRGADASQTLARASDMLEYTISVENTGKATTTIDMVDNLNDALEYADLVDNGGGTFDADAQTLTWAQVELKPGQRESRTFTMQMKSTIPSTPIGISNSLSYDCVITNTFGNTLNTNVDCPPVKQIEQVVSVLPQTGAGDNMLVAGVAVAVVTFFYARSRQLKTEVRLVRRNFNAGTI